MSNVLTVHSDDVEPLPFLTDVIAHGSVMEGGMAQWEVVLDKPAPFELKLQTKLVGAEQDDKNYPAPVVIIPKGSSAVIITLQTLDDDDVEGDKDLALFVLLPNEGLRGGSSAVTLTEGAEPEVTFSLSQSPEGQIAKGTNVAYTVTASSVVRDNKSVLLTFSGTDDNICASIDGSSNGNYIEEAKVTIPAGHKSVTYTWTA